MLYNIHAFAETKDFLMAVARSRGRLKKGGIPDVPGAARSILRDWNAGRIPYYTVPPAIPSSSTVAPGKAGGPAPAPSMLKSSDDIGSAAIVDALAPAFDLDSLFKEADSGALEGIKTSKELGPGGAVRLNESIGSMDVADGETGEFKLMGEKEEIDPIEEDDEEAPMLVPAPTASGKKRRSDADELLPAAIRQRQKKVSFNDAHAGPSGFTMATAAAPSQTAKMFADTPEEAPIQLNKSIKQQAKKDKKKKERAARHLAQDVDMAATVLEGFGVSDKKKEVDNGAPKPYDFKAFFGGGASAVPDEDDEM